MDRVENPTSQFGERLERARAGDRDALVALLERYGPPVRERIAGRLGEPWRASLDEDDVMQVTYLEAFVRIGSVTATSEGEFVRWLTTVAEHNLTDAIRALTRARRPDPRRSVTAVRPDAEASLVALVDRLGALSATPSRHAALGELKAGVDRALDGLPPDYATVVRLMDLQGCPGPEAARRMSRSLGAVHMLRVRAHRRLRELLGSDERFLSKS